MTDPAYRKPTWDELSKQRWGPSLRHDLPPIIVDVPRRRAVPPPDAPVPKPPSASISRRDTDE
jgi:hypothetical protein